jgi:hypothetical protein
MTNEQFWFNVVSVFAVLLSPLIAVQVTMWLQKMREARERKLAVFKALMRTRASRLAPEHVQALNMIDIEFYGKAKASRDVLAAWKAYLNQLNQLSATPTPPSIENWATRRDDLFFELLYAMAKCLEYEFDKTELRQTSYIPRGYGDIETDLTRIRTGLADIVEGKKALPIWAIPVPPNPVPPGPKNSTK